MSFFPSRHRCCPACNRRTIMVNGREEIEYYHRGVICHLVGFDLAAPLDLEMIQPGENEVTAARRLVRRVCRRYPRFFDAFVADALYFEAPFVNLCLEVGKPLVSVLKGDRRSLLQDAQGLFQDQEPKVYHAGEKTFRYWEEEGFEADGIRAPLRVLHTEESQEKRQRIGGRWHLKSEEHHWWWQTTIPAAVLPAPQLWAAGHRRWDIENDLFNTLATHWSLNHCYRHDPIAIENFVLTLFIAFVLLQSFYLRNLKPKFRKVLTLIALAREFYLDLAATIWTAPWLLRSRGSSP